MAFLPTARVFYSKSMNKMKVRNGERGWVVLRMGGREEEDEEEDEQTKGETKKRERQEGWACSMSHKEFFPAQQIWEDVQIAEHRREDSKIAFPLVVQESMVAAVVTPPFPNHHKLFHIVVAISCSSRVHRRLRRWREQGSHYSNPTPLKDHSWTIVLSND
jgi:hypothetical protein